MTETYAAKLFRNGASQAVRLPAQCRFPGEEVYARRDDVTGDVVLSSQPGAGVWATFFAMLDSMEVPADFMDERPLNVLPPKPGIFDDDMPGKG